MSKEMFTDTLENINGFISMYYRVMSAMENVKSPCCSDG